MLNLTYIKEMQIKLQCDAISHLLARILKFARILCFWGYAAADAKWYNTYYGQKFDNI